MVRQDRQSSVWGSGLLVAVIIALLVGVVTYDILNAAGGQMLPGSGPYRLVDNWAPGTPRRPALWQHVGRGLRERCRLRPQSRPRHDLDVGKQERTVPG